MAEPKKRTNNSKQGMRRMHDHVNSGAIVSCEKCHEPKEAHKVCYACGTFNNVQVLDLKK
ncbi:MAG: 50S ribosomal protein L32 [Candidatus Berkelbacteria bacterium]|jgi:large subunit ribosomal protein L32